MRIDVVSIFPDYLAPLRLSLVGKAIESGLVTLGVHDLRGWTSDLHRTVDDTPYGGGAGMVMRPEPWGLALDDLLPDESRLLLLTPAGRPFTQPLAAELAAEPHLVLACGRYEGVDARVVTDARRRARVDEVSIGDYVLNGGEAAALVVIEAVVRLLPGVLGNPDSLREESHGGEDRLLEYPLYTKPPVWRDLVVPDVLLSGHHGQIAAWRREQAVERTRRVRPDLLPAELVIEPARPADAGEVWTIEQAAYLTEGRLHHDFDIPPLIETLDELRAAIATQTFLVARLGARVVGSVRGRLEPDDVWYVGRLMVAPDLQGRGIGGELMRVIEGLAPPGARRFRLSTGGNSLRNLAFCCRRGYLETDRVAPPGKVPLLHLEKPVPD